MQINWNKNKIPEDDSKLLTNKCNNAYYIKNSTISVLVITANGEIYQTTRVQPSIHWERCENGDFCRVSSNNEPWRWNEEYDSFDVHDCNKDSSNIIAWAYNQNVEDILNI